MSTLGISKSSEAIITQYLQKKGSAEHVIKGGVQYLLESWKNTVTQELENKDYIWEEYLNDLDSRELLAEIVKIVDMGTAKLITTNLANLDKLFIEKTEASKCVWGENNKIRNNWDPKVNWWYFRIPKMLAQL